MKKINKNIFFTLMVICTTGSLFGVAKVTNAAGNWNNAAIWTPSGVPTAGDQATINHAVTIPVTSSIGNLIVSAAGSIHYVSGQSLVVNGNLTSAGSWVGSGILYKYGSGTVTLTAPINNTGIYVRFRPGANKTITIAVGSALSLQSVAVEAQGTTGGIVNNNGTLSFTTSFVIDGSITFNNAANGSLNVPRNITLSNGGIFNAAGNPNTVSYTGTAWTMVVAATYHNLLLDNGAGVSVGVKTLAGNITVNNNLTLASNVQLNCNNKNVSCAGIWTNNNSASNLTNTGGTFTFNGSNPSILRKTSPEVLGNVVVNCTGSLGMNSANTATYTGSFTCANLTLTAGIINFNAVGNYTVSVKGNFLGNGGSLNQQTSGLIQFTGAVAQTIGGTTPITFQDMTVNNSAGVSTTTAQSLTGTMTVTSGAFTSNVADFTIISNSATAATGRIAAVTGSLAGTRWIVQRRILTSGASTSTPYWDDFASPINGATLSDWDNEMYLSGCGGADGTACCPTFFSVKDWEGGSETNVSSLVALTPGKGFAVWTADNLNTLNAFTFDSRGTPNFGNVTHNCAAAGFFRMGNPYPSQIQWSLLTNINLGNYFYCLDETLQDYATWDQTSVAGTGKLNGSNGVLNSSQGFLTEALGAGSLKFIETAKVTTATSFVKLMNPKDMISFHFSNGQRQLGMESRICFADGADNGKDGFDMGYPSMSPYQKRYVVKTLTMDGKELCKNTLNLADGKHEIPMVFIPAEQGVFTVSFDGLKDFSSYNCVYLEDISEGTFTDLKNQNSYTFKTKSTNEKRFVIHFVRTDGTGETCVSKSAAFKIVEANTPIAGVFANPSGIVMNFSYKEMTKVKVVIYNSIGEVVSSTEQFYSEGQFVIEKPQAQGIYLVSLTDGKKVETHRLFID